MAQVAVINGSSRGLGLHFARYLLNNTNLQVVATSSRQSSKAREAILSDGLSSKGGEERLTTLDLDVTDEGSIEKAAKDVEGKFGKGGLRLMINVAGVLHPEKTVQKIDYDELMNTFKINTFGHALAFKHFTPLLPGKSTKHDYTNDPANGLIKENLSVLASMTARIGSIADNNSLGGWYSYRMSKAATNQLVKTVNLELQRASAGAGGTSSANSAIAVALHPGTLLGTDLSKPYVDPKRSDKDEKQKEEKKGVHSPEQGAEMLMQVIKSLTKERGGKFFDYAGKEIPW